MRHLFVVPARGHFRYLLTMLPSLKHLSLALLAGFSINAAAQESTNQPMNFVVFLADDLGYMDVGFNNASTFYETPNLDALALSGMVFTDFYAACQVCSPTRASLMTGKNPARGKMTNFFTGKRGGKFEPATLVNQLPTEEVTVAEALKEHGYRTCFAGKWHLGGKGHGPKDQGFDLNFGGGDNGLPRSYFSPYKNVDNLEAGPNGEFLTERLASESIGFLNEAAKSDEPFLLYHSFYSVHTPLQAPKDLVAKYEAKAKEMGIAGDEGSFEIGRERQIWPGVEPRKVRIRQDHATYAAMVESLDAAVGRIISRVDELGLTQKTTIIFTSDNGGTSTSEGHPTSNLPLRGGKGWMYEGGIREPMVIRVPGLTSPGTRCTIPAVTMDLYPTILDLAGEALRGTQHLDGVSLMPALKNPFTKFDRGPIFFHYPHYSNQGGFPASAVRMGDLKLIQDLEDGEYELYDVRNDMAEHNDLSQLYDDELKEMVTRLDDWRREIDAEPLQKNPKTGAEPPKLW